MRTELFLQLESESDLQPFYERVADSPELMCGFAMTRPDEPGIDTWLFHVEKSSFLPMMLLVAQQVCAASSLCYFSRYVGQPAPLSRGTLMAAKFRASGGYRVRCWDEHEGWRESERSLPIFDWLGSMMDALGEQVPLSLPLYQGQHDMDLHMLLLASTQQLELENEEMRHLLVRTLHRWVGEQLAAKRFPDIAVFGAEAPYIDKLMPQLQVSMNSALTVPVTASSMLAFQHEYAGATAFLDDMIRVCSNLNLLWAAWSTGRSIDLLLADPSHRLLFRGPLCPNAELEQVPITDLETIDLDLLQIWQEAKQN